MTRKVLKAFAYIRAHLTTHWPANIMSKKNAIGAPLVSAIGGQAPAPLKPPSRTGEAVTPMYSVDLFSGCGGLAFGLAEAGFHHVLVVEKDLNASETLTANQKRMVRHFKDWTIAARDVREIDYHQVEAPISLVAGGPPCQPFSIGGKHKGPDDIRNMWPEAIRAVQILKPSAFVFENVRGLLRPAFGNYLSFLQLQLTWPDISIPTKSWRKHLRLLMDYAKSGAAPWYHVAVRGLNAADYGAPQKRHRAMIIGVRSDIASQGCFPSPTHSHESLVWSQRVTGEYWDHHRISRQARPAISETDNRILRLLLTRDAAPSEQPWVTVRDAIGDLGNPLRSRASVDNHLLHPGARIYARHTGSTWDEPAKALKAGDHGVPGGENILVGRRGSVRYFTLREMARLQGLPDEFVIEGTWKAPIKQLGNAVPVQVGEAFGSAIMRLIQGARQQEAA